MRNFAATAALVGVGWCGILSSDAVPVPAVQTPRQRAFIANITPVAEAASTAAEPELVSFLDSDDFRENFKQ
jgi:hypothetical protein